jgi:hypothetical protein
LVPGLYHCRSDPVARLVRLGLVPRVSAPVCFSFLASCYDPTAGRAPGFPLKCWPPRQGPVFGAKTFPSRSVLPHLGSAASSPAGFPSRLIFVFPLEACYLIFLSPPRFCFPVDFILPLFCAESDFGLGLCSCVPRSCAHKVFLPPPVLIFAGFGLPPLDA